MSWFIAGLGIGFVIGVMAHRYFKRFNKDKELTTEDCVEVLKSKGYWVNLNVSPTNYKDKER